MDILDKINPYIEENRVDEDAKQAFEKMFGKLKSFPWRKAKSVMLDGARDFVDFVIKAGFEPEVLDIVNDIFFTRFSDLDDVVHLRVLGEDKINEGIKDWWGNKSASLFKTVSYMPFKNAYKEIKSLLKTGNADYDKMAFYFLLWIIAATGKLALGKITPKTQKKLAIKSRSV